MKRWLVYAASFLMLLTFVLLTSGCSTYIIGSTGVFATTGKGVGDHITSTATGNDCDTVKLVSSRQDYYCERPREPGTTYNRNSF